MMGVVMVVLTAIAVVWLVTGGVPRPWRLVVFVPAWIGALDFLQVRAGTCVLLAARGVRNMDSGNEPITDSAELARVRSQARMVHIQSLLLAGCVTTIVAVV